MIYFDNSATTKPYREVLESFLTVSSEYFGNPSSLHGIGAQAENLLTQARTQIADLLNAKASEIFFTSGGTESNNMAIKGVAMRHRNRGRHLITTAIEHPSVARAMEQLEQLGFEITYLPVNRQGMVMVSEVEKAIRQDTILVSVMHVNNEVGTIQPINEIGALLKNYPKVLFHVDAVQSIGKVPLHLHEWGVDLCSFSAHKFHGLKGTGLLFIREGVQLDPLLAGGNQEWKRRSGTENVAGAVSTAKALRMLLEKGKTGTLMMKRIQSLLTDGLYEIDGVQVQTSPSIAAPHIVNFTIDSIKAETFIHMLEKDNIYASTTSACSSRKQSPSKTLLAMGVSEQEALRSVRLSLSFDNTEEEARFVLKAIKKAIWQLRKE
ncbi:cysteine desulfurase family protein [Neobacillus sp. SM06]|uniref:cysteine desulfurase family protein n=1 Tax=Neobacillus sp. SM06 TaxID=3422492 RepID=UPI003D2DF976